jgi:succinoglycan biosynthesis transport protein ExoP
MDTIEQILNANEQSKDVAAPSPYLYMVKRYKWRIFILSTLVACLVAWYTTSIPALYKATATLLIEADQAQAVAFEAVQGLDSNRKEYYLTQFEILKSNSIAEIVFDKLNLQDHPAFQKSKSWREIIASNVSTLAPLFAFFSAGDNTDALSTEGGNNQLSVANEKEEKRRALIRSFSNSLEITPIRKTQLVTVSFVSEDPILAALVANTVGETYVSQDYAVKSDINQNAAHWLTSRLEDLRLSLDKSEAVLQTYRKKENIIDLKDNNGRGLTGLVSIELEQTSHQLIEAKNEVNQLNSIVRAVRDNGIKNIANLESITEITSHPVIQNIKKVKVMAKLKVSELAQVFGPKHPTLIAARSELRTVDRQLITQIEKLVAGLDKQLKTKKRNVVALETEYKNIQAQFQNVIGKDNTYQKLVREVESNRELYNTFLSRSKETELTSDFNAAVARFTDRAYVPSKSITLSKYIVIVIAFVLTVSGCIIALMVNALLTDSFTSVGDIEQKLGLPVLGILPQVAMKKNKDLDLHYFFEENGRQFAESVRTLRTSLLLGQGEDKSQVMAIISSQPNEGKSTMSINFAFSLSQIESTILIDADMRKPSLARLFNIPKDQPGLADVIAGKANLFDCIYKDKVSGISILPCGRPPSNAQELLSSSRFDQLLQSLKQSYDRIIIDTPPIQAVSDSLIIATHTDAIIYVIKSEVTKVRLVKTGIRRLKSVNANIAGVVMNNVNTDGLADSDYYYGYYSETEYGEYVED